MQAIRNHRPQDLSSQIESIRLAAHLAEVQSQALWQQIDALRRTAEIAEARAKTLLAQLDAITEAAKAAEPQRALDVQRPPKPASGPKSAPYELRAATIDEVRPLFEEHHGYKSVGGRVATYCFAVFEDGKPIAAFVWNPPPPGAAKSVCPECPQGVLSLSRMVAIPKSKRRLKHISKPLRRQMFHLIDRTRWPCLVTFSDEGQGHTGFVYQCSGWTKTTRSKVTTLTIDGKRVSTYFGGRTRKVRVESENRSELLHGAVKSEAHVQRWEHRTPNPKSTFDSVWERVAIPGKVWASGAQAFAYRKRKHPRRVAEIGDRDRPLAVVLPIAS